MEEQVLENENTENFSVGDTVGAGEEMTVGTDHMNEARNDRSRELEEENMRLRGELACAKVGVPGEIAGDIVSIAAKMKNDCGDEGFVLEDAVREVYGRICSAVYGACGRKEHIVSGAFGKGSSGVTTGVRSERSFDESDAALRRACGLRN